MKTEIYQINTRQLNQLLMARIARLKEIAAKGINRTDSDAARRLIIKYGY